MTNSGGYLNALPTRYRLQEFELLSVLGAGGFGITYKAFDHLLNKNIAIKEYLPNDFAVRRDHVSVLPKSSADQANFAWGLERFLDEARVLAHFDHPNIIRVHRYFESNGTAYIVMDYAEGETLAATLRLKGTLAANELTALLYPILDGLEEVHRAQFLHRDLKPGNIILRADGTPIILDFGAARQAVSAKSRSVTAIITPGYAPIEQYSTKGNQGPWTDIYALAAIAYRAIVGERPDDATERVYDDPLKDWTERVEGWDRPFLAAVNTALSFREDDRPQSIAQWKKLLLADGSTDSSNLPPPIREPVKKPTARSAGRMSVKMASTRRWMQQFRRRARARAHSSASLALQVSGKLQATASHSMLVARQRIYRPAVDHGTDTPRAESEPSPDFRPPRRRRKALLSVAVVVIGVVVYLVYLMARAPDAERGPEGVVESTIAALPNGTLSAVDIGEAAQGLQRALNINADNAVALEALSLLMGRVAEQVETDIVRGELDRANEALSEAAARWTGEREFSGDGGLRKRLQDALYQRDLFGKVAELVAAAEVRLTRDPEGGEATEAVSEALGVLRRVLDVDPDNTRAQSIRDDIRENVTAATRNALDAREPQRARHLLDAVAGEWSGDSELNRLRSEVERQFEELDTELEIQRLLDLAQRRLGADMLTTPAGESAAAYYGRVLALDPNNEPAREGIERISDRYVVLIGKAIDNGIFDRARRLLGSLETLLPVHPQIASFRAGIVAGEQVAAAANTVTPTQADSALPSAQAATKASDSAPTEIPTDDEGLLWYEVKDSCVEAEIRRYMEAYPAGRYIDDAWRKISSCIESR